MAKAVLVRRIAGIWVTLTRHRWSNEPIVHLTFPPDSHGTTGSSTTHRGALRSAVWLERLNRRHFPTHPDTLHHRQGAD